jgi:putative transcriptional regulator
MAFEIPEGKTLTGMVLASAPELLDPNFHKTVVYIAEHSPAGALGLVMNRPLGRTLGEVTKGADIEQSLLSLPVYEGGPVKPMSLLFARFVRGAHDERLRCEIVSDPAELAAMSKRGGCLRVFAGYAGWGEGQLERELGEDSWKVCPPHIAMLEEPVPPALWPAFISDDQRWRKLHRLLPKDTGQN